MRDFHGVYRRGYHYYSAWHHRFGRQSCEVSETVQAYAEKAGDSLQWGKDIFRDKFRDKVQDKVQDWSDSSQEILANMQATAASILNKQQRRMINAFPRLRFTDSIKYSKIIETLHEMLRRK